MQQDGYMRFITLSMYNGLETWLYCRTKSIKKLFVMCIKIKGVYSLFSWLLLDLFVQYLVSSVVLEVELWVGVSVWRATQLMAYWI